MTKKQSQKSSRSTGRTIKTINDAIEKYLDTIKQVRSDNTARAYKNALNVFRLVLEQNKLSPEDTPITQINEHLISKFAASLKTYSPATERLYIQAVSGFYKYLAAEQLSEINLPRLELLIKQRTRKPGIRLPQFPSNEIERIIDHVTPLTSSEKTAEFVKKSSQKQLNIRLRELRDRAFLVTLADTGLRVHEACNLRRGDMDWNEGRAVIVGKGDKQAVVRFSQRAILALKNYLQARSNLDGSSGRPLGSLPLFARHDKGAGKKVKPITPTGGRNLVNERVREILGEEAVGRITPHSFRHYFVTTVLRGSGNLKLAQELARHSNIQVTQRYVHLSNDELDKGYHEIFEQKHNPAAK